MTDPYGVLGVRPDATDAEIAKAYKRLAKRYHPDLNPDDPVAAQRMGRINQAYDEIKHRRRSGEPQSRRAADADPFTSYYRDYRRSYSTDYSDEYAYRRPASPFRFVVALMLAVLILHLFGVLLGETPPVQRFRQQFAASASSEPKPDYPVFTHLYP